MALSVRRSSDWSVVLRTEAGQVINFDRQNLRLRSVENDTRTASNDAVTRCPLCQQEFQQESVSARAETFPSESLNESDPTTSPFVHPEYFGYLALCYAGEHALVEESDLDRLDQESFNQGYCARFFVEEGLLGRGGKGEVVKVRHILQGVSLGTFALKRVAVGNSQSWLLRTLQEVQSARFKHPNLVSYNHVWLERRQTAFSPMVPVLHILQEFCDGGDLETFVTIACGKSAPTVEQMKARFRRRSRGEYMEEMVHPALSPDMIYSFFKDILTGLEYLHSQGMLHRDMKSSNCLLNYRDAGPLAFPRVMVSDFGEAQAMSSTDTRGGFTGTLSYCAPEIVRGENWTAGADMFSLGMILYFLTHEGTLPYHSESDDVEELRKEILSFESCKLRRLCGGEKRELEAVLGDLLSPDHTKRPSCKSLLSRLQLHEVSSSNTKPYDTDTMNQASTSRPETWPSAHSSSPHANSGISTTVDEKLCNSLIRLRNEDSLNHPEFSARLRAFWAADPMSSEAASLCFLVIRIVLMDLCWKIGSKYFLLTVLLCISLFEMRLHVTSTSKMLHTVVLCSMARLHHFLFQ